MESTREELRNILMETPYLEIMYNIDEAVDYLIDNCVTVIKPTKDQPTSDVVEVVRCEKCKHGDVSTFSLSKDGEEYIG